LCRLLLLAEQRLAFGLPTSLQTPLATSTGLKSMMPAEGGASVKMLKQEGWAKTKCGAAKCNFAASRKTMSRRTTEWPGKGYSITPTALSMRARTCMPAGSVPCVLLACWPVGKSRSGASCRTRKTRRHTMPPKKSKAWACMKKSKTQNHWKLQT